MPEPGLSRAHRHLSSCTDGTEQAGLSFDVLGPLRITHNRVEIAFTSRRQRALLVLFAINAKTVLPADRLVDHLWDGAPPHGAAVTLRSYISHLRKSLRTHGMGQVAITTTDSGYRLDVDPDAVDVIRFRGAVASGHLHARRGEWLPALAAFDAALSLWRGQPVMEVADHAFVAALVAELTELYTGAREGRMRTLIELGRLTDAIPALERLISEEPLREEPRELLMHALHRAGRTADALEVHRRFRTVLREELGIEPSAGLDQLVASILNRDPRLDPVAHLGWPTVDAFEPQQPLDVALALVEALRALSAQVGEVLDALDVHTGSSTRVAGLGIRADVDRPRSGAGGAAAS